MGRKLGAEWADTGCRGVGNKARKTLLMSLCLGNESLEDTRRDLYIA